MMILLSHEWRKEGMVRLSWYFRLLYHAQGIATGQVKDGYPQVRHVGIPAGMGTWICSLPASPGGAQIQVCNL